MLRTLVCASLAACAVADTAATAAKSSPAASESAGVDYKKFIPDFKQYMPKMSKSDSNGFIPDYEKYLDTDKYTKFAKFMEEHHTGPTSAEKCNTTKQLDEWRTRMEAPMKAFLPKQWRDITESHFEQEYKQNLKRIQSANAAKKETASEKAAPARLLLAKDRSDQADSSQKFSSYVPDFNDYFKQYQGFMHGDSSDYQKYMPQGASGFDSYLPKDTTKGYSDLVPDYEKYMNVKKYMDFAVLAQKQQAPASAEMCKTKAELDAWRRAREAPIKAFVPKDYQHWSMDSIKAEYNTNEAPIEAAEKAKNDAKPADKDAAPAMQTLNLLAVPEVLPAQSASSPAAKPTPADQAKAASAARDDLIKEAREGVQRIADFKVDTSNCTAEAGQNACNQARDAQKKALRQMRTAAKAATQHSKKAGQDACKFARKAGVSESVAEKERDEAEREAERLEEQAEQAADKAVDSVANRFDEAWAAAQKSASEATAAKEAADAKPAARMLLEASAEAPKDASAVASKDSSDAPQKEAEQAERPQQPESQKDGKAFDYQQFIPDYAKSMDYQKYMKFAQFMQHTKAPNKAQDCKSKADLDAWRSVQEATTKEYVPKEWQDAPMASIQKKYEQNLARIKAEKAAAKAQAVAKAQESMSADQPDKAATDTESSSASDDTSSGFHWPLLLATRFSALHSQSATNSEKLLVAAKSAESQKYVPNYANYMDVEKFAAVSNSVEDMDAPESPSDCKTMKELDAWFKKQKAILKKYVPSAYQKYPLASLEKKYKSEEARIKAVASNSTATTEAPAADQLAAVATSRSLPLVACGVLVAMLASFATVAFTLARRASQDRALEENLLSHDAPLAA